MHSPLILLVPRRQPDQPTGRRARRQKASAAQISALHRIVLALSVAFGRSRIVPGG